MKHLLTISFLFFLTTSCSQQEKKESEHSSIEAETSQAYKETMVVHDAVMPKMDNIMHLKKRLKARIDSLQSSNLDTAAITTLNPLVVALEDADKAMMDWMHQFDSSKRTDTSQTAITYYSSQKEIIEAVANKMNSAIKNAKEGLN